MKSFCVTIMGLRESVDAAERCQESGRAFGLEIHQWEATTSEDRPEELFEASGWPTDKFFNKWNRPEAAMAAFLSHHSLWKACATENDQCFLILEHDAVIVDRVPDLYPGEKLLTNMGKPSFGKFKTPQKEGFAPFSSNPHPRGYLKGAHGYLISPSGAREILQRVKREAEPTDIFLNKERFPWMTEFYPWPVGCKDSFSCIQKEAGCRAKHNTVTPI